MRSVRMKSIKRLRPFAAVFRWRRIAGFRRLRALAHATRALYASDEPYAPFRTVNDIQRAVSTNLPAALNIFVPPNLHAAAGKRAAQAVLVSAQAQLVREAILAWHERRHRAWLPVPPAVWKVWRGGDECIGKDKSWFTFAVYLASCWMSGFLRFLQLVRYMRSKSVMPAAPYVVAMHVGADVVGCAAKGGFLRWLKNAPIVASDAQEIVVVSRDAAKNIMGPDWLHISSEALPPLERVSFGFLFKSSLLLALTPFLALAGVWQGLVLLSDLVELHYALQLPDSKLARAYLFLLGDQARRPLWTFYVASRGARTPLIFYASSYPLFAYGAKVPADIRHPSLLVNIWDECWFQTENAHADIAALLPHNPDCRIVGAFDMVDSGDALPRLPIRAVAAFDVEPNARPLRLTMAGYIFPTVTEDVINAYWRKLTDSARKLDFVIVHKPKRFGLLQQEWRYRSLLQTLEAEGRYVSLSPTTGPMRLMRQVVASVILPFTSVGDLAIAIGANAFYLDAYGTIPDAEKFSGGLPVVVGVDAMSARLAECLDKPLKSLKALV